MAAIKIGTDAAGANAKLAGLERALANPRPVYETIGRAIRSRILLCFKLGIDPWGSPWAALKFRKGQPLKDRGRTGLSRIVANPDSTGVTIGTTAQAKIGRTHQFGATIVPKNPGGRLVFPGPNGRIIFAKKVTIPARPFLPLRRDGAIDLPPAWSASVVAALRTYLRQASEKAEA